MLTYLFPWLVWGLFACTTEPEPTPSLRDNCEGGVVESEADLEALLDCRSVTGDLTLEQEGHLPNLVRVEGVLTLGPEAITLPRLLEARSLWVSTGASPDLPQLVQVTETLLLASPVTLPALRRATSVVLRGDAVSPLESTAEIEHLILQTSNRGSFRHDGPVHQLTVDRLPELERLHLPQASLRSAQIREAPALRTLVASFAPHADRVVLDTPSLSTLTGTDALVSIQTLELVDHTLTSLDLSNLKTAHELTVYHPVDALTLPKLTRVGELILELDQPSLDLRHTELGNVTLSVEHDFTLSALRLNRLELYSSDRVILDGLEQAGVLHLHNTEHTTAHQLQQVDRLELSGGLSDLDMPILSTIGTLHVERTRNPAPLAGLPALRELDHLYFERTIARQLAGDLHGIRSVTLTTNPQLSDIRALEGASPESWRTIDNGFTALPALTATQMRVLELSENVTDLTGLESLEELDHLRLLNNPVLTDLDGLSGLRTVTQRMEVLSNPLLCSSRVDAWLTNIDYDPSWLQVRDNNDGC